MCHVLIFESNVKSRESWFLSVRITYFLEARMCYLLKIASWSAWKAAPVWLSPVGSSCVYDRLYCSHVSPKVTCPEASSGQVYLLQYPFLLSHVLFLCWWPVVVFGPHLFGYTSDMLRAMHCVLCCVLCWHQACSTGPSHFGLASVWSCLPIFLSYYVTGHTF